MDIKIFSFVFLLGVCNTEAARTSQNNVTTYCPPLPYIPRHSTVHSLNEFPRALGATLFFSCPRNYKLVGKNDIVCTNQGWSRKRLPRCKVRKCPNPGQPENGRRVGNDFKIGATVIFFCRSGYQLFGSHQRVCQEDETWSGNLTTCDDGSTYCPNPGIPVSSKKIGKRYNFGNVVKYSCKPRHTLRGSRKRRCQVDGTWTGVAPVCEDDSIPPISVVSKLLKDNFAKPLTNTSCASKAANCTPVDARLRAFRRNYVNGLDLIFVLDSSTSVTEQYFKLGLELVKEIVRMFRINQSGTRIACVTFGTLAVFEFGFGDHSVSTKAKAIERISKIKFRGGGTATRQALDIVRRNVLALARRDSKKAVMFITDGKSNIGGPPASAARRLKRKGVEIYVIGVGTMVKKKELRAIASRPYKNHVFRIAHHGDIEALIDSITDFSECGRDTGSSPRIRIVGGKFSPRGKWPWAAVVNGPSGLCGGTVLNKRWILTAAHCIVPDSPIQLWSDNYSADKFTVKLGVTNLAKNRTEHIDVGVEDNFVHQNFVGEPSLKNDIGLLKLKIHPRFQKFNKYIQRICLPWKINFTERYKSGRGGIVVGWGHTKKVLWGSKDPGMRADSLKEAFLPFVNSSVCQNRASVGGREEDGWLFDNNTMFCAGNGKGVNDTCKGDSGGPFLVKQYDREMGIQRWYQVGITSWGVGCANKGEYAYLTKVTAYLDWISKTMKDNTP